MGARLVGHGRIVPDSCPASQVDWARPYHAQQLPCQKSGASRFERADVGQRKTLLDLPAGPIEGRPVVAVAAASPVFLHGLVTMPLTSILLRAPLGFPITHPLQQLTRICRCLL